MATASVAAGTKGKTSAAHREAATSLKNPCWRGQVCTHQTPEEALRTADNFPSAPWSGTWRESGVGAAQSR